MQFFVRDMSSKLYEPQGGKIIPKTVEERYSMNVFGVLFQEHGQLHFATLS